MVGWQRHIQLIFRGLGKRLEYSYNASANSSSVRLESSTFTSQSPISLVETSFECFYVTSLRNEKCIYSFFSLPCCICPLYDQVVYLKCCCYRSRLLWRQHLNQCLSVFYVQQKCKNEDKETLLAFAGEIPYLHRLWRPPSANISRPSYQCLQQLVLLTSIFCFLK